VQTVLVVVRRIVDVVVLISMLVVLPVVWVNVTGQTVVEMVVSTVVMTSVTLVEGEAAGDDGVTLGVVVVVSTW
jgi:hypothetical protein